MSLPDIGSIIDATVIRLERYGAWIDYQGSTGLILIPEISWTRISATEDVLSIGQQVRVKVLLHTGEGKFSASIRQVQPELDPWRDPSQFAVGAEFTGRVMLITNYGCFIELRPDLWGLLLREKWTGEPSVGDQMRVRVESVDHESRKIEVSPAATGAYS